jgi:hypothetical protein
VARRAGFAFTVLFAGVGYLMQFSIIATGAIDGCHHCGTRRSKQVQNNLAGVVVLLMKCASVGR